MGGGKTGSGGQPSSSKALEDITMQMFGETTPLRQEFINQLFHVLTTGGYGDYAPGEKPAKGPIVGYTEGKPQYELTSGVIAGKKAGDIITQGEYDYLKSYMGGRDPMEAGFVRDIGKVSEPIYGDVEDVKTGGGTAWLPAIQKAMEQSRRATSRAMTGTTESLAKTGLVGTPFGQRILAGTRLEGEQATGAVPGQVTAQLLQMLPGFITGQGQTVVSGLGSAAGAQATTMAAERKAEAAEFAALMGALPDVGFSYTGSI
jgi:hypothetical protein